MSKVSRRSFLLAGGSAAIVGVAAAAGLAGVQERLRWRGGDPFSLGVASGHPTADGFVLWTRLAPHPLTIDPDMPGGLLAPDLPVRYEIAADPAFQRVVQQGWATAEASYAHSVHLEVRGLQAGRPYWYRFACGDAVSRTGRAMTAPPPGAAVERLRFGFVSCSHFEHGYFSAYRHLAAEHPDVVLYLGDYIYEYAAGGPAVRLLRDRAETTRLAAYRFRYAEYRSDPDLQALHAECPSLVTWDDHEVQNDYADQWSESFDEPDVFLARRAAAYQAFYEHMPLRTRPNGPSLRIYGRTSFGSLADISVLDGRQYRSRKPCYYPPENGGAYLTNDADCPERKEVSRTMLGMPQEAWLYNGFRQSRARWNIVAQAMMMTELREPYPGDRIGYLSEDWNGYPACRARLLRQIQACKLSNPIVVAGDMHSFWTNDLKVDFADERAPVIATELVGTSVTSIPPPAEAYAKLLAQNPHVRYFDSGRNGYVSVDLTRERMAARLRVVSDVADPDASVSTLKTFVVEDGCPGAVGA